MPRAVLKVQREELDDLFDRDDLLFEQGGRHPLLDDDASERQDCEADLDSA